MCAGARQEERVEVAELKVSRANRATSSVIIGQSVEMVAEEGGEDFAFRHSTSAAARFSENSAPHIARGGSVV